MDNQRNNTSLQTQIIRAILIAVLIVIYIIPISSNISYADSVHSDVYTVTRLLIVPLTMLAQFILRMRTARQLIEYFVLLMLAFGSYVIYDEIPWTSLLLLIYFITYDVLDNYMKKVPLKKRMVRIVAIIFVFQVIFITTYNHLNRVSSTFKDANYTGYFLVILYYLLGSESNKKIIQWRDIVLVLAFLTFSRNTMIAVLLIEMFRLTRFEFGKYIKNAAVIFYIILAAWLIVCELFISYFNTIEYSYTYFSGLSRLTSFVDYSNYIRAFANISLLHDVNLKYLLFGYSDEAYTALVFFENKIAHPHNTFMAIYQQSGLFFSISLVRRLAAIFNDNKEYINMYIVLLLFAMILGPSLYYGIDLILILVAVRLNQQSQTGSLINEFGKSEIRANCRYCNNSNVI